MKQFDNKVNGTSVLQANGANSFLSEMEETVIQSGQTLDTSGESLPDPDIQQLARAMVTAASQAWSYTETGTTTANQRFLETAGDWVNPTGYVDDMVIRFKSTIANTGAVQIDIGGFGLKDFVLADGSALTAGDLNVNDDVVAYYDETADHFQAIIIPVQTQVVEDAAAQAEAAQTAAENAQAAAEAAQAAAEGAAETVVVGRFNSVAGAAASTIDAVVKTVQLTGFTSGGDGGDALYAREETEPSHEAKFRSQDRFLPDGSTDNTNGGWWGIADAEVNVLQFGARGDVNLDTENGGTDDSTAFQNAYNYGFQFSKVVFVPGGRGYRLSSSINCYNDTDLSRECGFEGETLLTSVLYNDVADNTASMIDFSGASRQNRKIFGNLRLRRHGNLTNASEQAAYFDLGELGGNSRIYNLECGGSRNTHIRARGQSNVYMNDIVTFGGGAHFPYKNTSGVTFSGSEGSTTVTASSAIFTDGSGGTTNDAGNMIFFDNSDTGGTVSGQYQISSVNSSTEVTLTSSLQQSMTSAPGIFEPPRVNGQSGSTNLVAESDCFEDHHVGLHIWVVNADSTKGLARRRIVSLNGTAPTNSVVVDEAWDRNFGNNQFGTSVVEIYDPSQSSATESNDLDLERFHIEDYRGVGLVVDRASRFSIRRIKIHAVASQNDNSISVAHAWFANVQGVMNDVILDGNQRGRSGKLTFSQQGNRIFRINDVMFNGHFNDEFIQAFSFSGSGRVVVGDITVAGNLVGRDDFTLFDDPNTIKRISGNGAFSTSQDEDFTVFLEGQVYRASASGTPEGSFAAPIGSTYNRIDGAAGTSFYVKESGTGNTGWAAK